MNDGNENKKQATDLSRICRRDCLKLTGAAALALSAGAGTRSRAAGPAILNPVVRGKKVFPEGKLSVVLLGTGTPLPNPRRACASTLVIAGEKTFLIDAGRGFLSNLDALGLSDVSTVFFTHYHSDHYGEFGELLVHRTIMGARVPLRVMGPEGAAQVLGGIARAYELDVRYRQEHHKDKYSGQGTQAEVMEKMPGVVYDEEGVKVTMFEVDHAPAAPAVGYRFDYAGKSVVVSGDTRKVAMMTEMARGCDVLVHEAVNKTLINRAGDLLNLDERMRGMMMEMMDYHTSTEEAAEIARDANVKTLVLTHMVPAPEPNPASEAIFVGGMRKIFRGEIKVGRDLMEIPA